MEHNTIITVEFGPKNVAEYVQIDRYPTRRRYITTCYDNVTPASVKRLANVCKTFTKRTVTYKGSTIRHTITN